MKNKIVWIIIAIIVLGGIAWWGQSKNKAPVTREPIKIGIIMPFTGNSAESGENARRGLLIAKDDINNSTATKYKIDLIFEDSQYKSDISVAAAQKLITVDGVKYIIGDHGSSQTLALAPIVEQNKVVLISPSSQADNITNAGDYVFRTQINTKQESKYFADYLINKIGKEKIDILTLNTDYGISYIDDFSKDIKELGGSVGLVQKYDSDESDFKTYLLKIKNGKSGYVLLIGTRKSNGLILNQAGEIKLNTKFFASSATEDRVLIQTAGVKAEGLIYPYPFDNNSTSTKQVSYQDKYYNQYKEKSEMISANSYDALRILSDCFEKVGIDVEKVKNCLYDIKNYSGASGILTFDKNGDVSKPFIIKTVKNSQFVKLEQ